MIPPSTTSSQPQDALAPAARATSRPAGVRCLLLGDWRFEPDRNRIETAGQEAKLEPKQASLLLLLAESGGRVVLKDEIIEAVWGGRFIADSAITRTMAELRRALGDDAHHPRFIETIPKRGYRLLVPAVSEDAAATTGEPPASAPLRRRRWHHLLTAALCMLTVGGYAASRHLSLRDLRPAGGRAVMLAVLPLDNLSRDPGEDYFADGMTEALITSLAQIGSVGVISRRSVETFRASDLPLAEIAHTLGVAAVVEGSILKADGRVRVTVQLTDVEDDAHLWAQSYERPLSDILAMQSEIALAIAREIRATLTPGSGSLSARGNRIDPQLYELYLKGRHYLDRCAKDGANKAAELFQAALAIDPTYAPAHAGLAEYYTQLSFHGHLSPERALPLARFAATRALELDDTLAEAHLASAFVRYTFDWDWAGAEADFRRALALAPNSAAVHQRYAFFLACLARFEEALTAARRAVDLDPLTDTTRTVLAWVYMNAGRYEESLVELEKIRELRLTTHESPYVSWNYSLLGQHETVLAKLETKMSEGPLSLAIRGWLLAQAGELRQARELAREIERLAAEEPVDPYAQATVYAGLGEVELALAALEDAYANRSTNMIFLKVEPFFASLASDSRYGDILARMGLGEAFHPGIQGR